jgi:ATP-dependent Clp protease adapter protein ClpS
MSQHPTDRPEFPPDPARPRPETSAGQQPPRRDIPRCRVVLLHDNTTDMMFIVRTVMELTRFCRAEATHKMWEAHHCGRSVLFTTYRERAELFVEQLASRGLKVTIEGA